MTRACTAVALLVTFVLSACTHEARPDQPPTVVKKAESKPACDAQAKRVSDECNAADEASNTARAEHENFVSSLPDSDPDRDKKIHENWNKDGGGHDKWEAYKKACLCQ